MIIRHRKPRIVRLYCDGRNCTAHEDFAPSTTNRDVVTWCARHSWKITHRGWALFDHRCEDCTRRSMAPAAYWERLAS